MTRPRLTGGRCLLTLGPLGPHRAVRNTRRSAAAGQLASGWESRDPARWPHAGAGGAGSARRAAGVRASAAGTTLGRPCAREQGSEGFPFAPSVTAWGLLPGDIRPIK